MVDATIELEIKRLLRIAHQVFLQDDPREHKRILRAIFSVSDLDPTGFLSERTAIGALELARFNKTAFKSVSTHLIDGMFDRGIPPNRFRFDLLRLFAAEPESLIHDSDNIRQEGFGIRHEVLSYVYEVPDELKNWRLTQFLGEGGFGYVFKARRKFTSSGDSYQKAAIKILKDDGASDPDFHRRFVREMQTIANLQHPNIAPLIDFSDSASEPWYATTLLDGQDLESFMRKNGTVRKEEPVLRFLTSMLSALDLAHRNRVVQRDVSPNNIIYVPKSRSFWLIDFGLAIDSGRTNDVAHGSGNFFWMSPEQLSGDAVTPATDILSLAMVCVYIVSGKNIFSSASSSERVDAMRNARATQDALFRLVPARLAQFLLPFLSPDPIKRPTAREALSHLSDSGISKMPSLQRIRNPYHAGFYDAIDRAPASDDMTGEMSEEMVSLKNPDELPPTP
jgi:serine/threonine protein kinase